MRAQLTRTALLAATAGVLAAVATAGVVLSRTPALTANERVVRIAATRFTYEPAEVTLVRGQPVVLELVSLDRSHGFRVPSLNIRAEVPENGVARVRLVPERAGRFFFTCDVFCGSGHDEMEGEIVVREP